jgi:hypothetical protein
MFHRVIEDFKESASRALRLTSLAAVAAFSLFVTIAFLCAAAFVYVFQKYGLIEACLTGAAVFFVVGVIAGSWYLVRKNQVRARAPETAKSAGASAFADPALLAVGLQLVRALGVRKLIPILAVGGLALGLLASRNNASDQAPAE